MCEGSETIAACCVSQPPMPVVVNTALFWAGALEKMNKKIGSATIKNNASMIACLREK
ncbi:MAG: hypothetical protein LBN07_00660 [Christensenellaceae bacterium]|jgi:hypothetical protein|nr:hypothetical protein [Christensenellaceae bacterium]